MAIFLSFFIIPSYSMGEERPTYFNFWPLFQYTSDPIRGVREIEGFGPFFHWKKDYHQKQWGIRPLLYWTGEENESLWRLEFLYPLGKYEEKKGTEGVTYSQFLFTKSKSLMEKRDGTSNSSRFLSVKRKREKTILASFLSMGSFLTATERIKYVFIFGPFIVNPSPREFVP